jgi:hypothetical protein
MENVPATINNNVPASFTPPQQEQILKSDIVIPKVLQMQALSKFVEDNAAKAGDFVRSSTGEVLGGAATPLEFIPLSFQNLWMISENENGDNKTFEFKGYEPRTASNEVQEWEYFENGVKHKRTKVMNVYALLPKDIEKQIAAMESYKKTGEMPDLEAALLPVVIPFRNTSFKAAKDVATLFVKAADLAAQMGADVPVYGRTMKLSNVKEKNDKGAYYVLKVESGSATKKEYHAACKRWRDNLLSMAGAVKVDESDVVADAVKEAEAVFDKF